MWKIQAGLLFIFLKVKRIIKFSAAVDEDQGSALEHKMVKAFLYHADMCVIKSVTLD